MPTATRPAATSKPAPIKTLGDFAGAVLARLGLPNTKPNRDFIVAWAQVENTKAANNPLATTYTAQGLQSAPLPGNPDGVQQYATPQAGVEATAATLKHYPSILAAFRTGDIYFPSFKPSPGLLADFAKWSGNKPGSAAGLDYFQKISRNSQGGEGSAADIGSYDLTNLGHDVKNALVPDWEAGAIRVGLYLVFTFAAFGLLFMGLNRAGGGSPARALGTVARPGAKAAASGIPF